MERAAHRNERARELLTRASAAGNPSGIKLTVGGVCAPLLTRERALALAVNTRVAGASLARRRGRAAALHRPRVVPHIMSRRGERSFGRVHAPAVLRHAYVTARAARRSERVRELLTRARGALDPSGARLTATGVRGPNVDTECALARARVGGALDAQGALGPYPARAPIAARCAC